MIDFEKDQARDAYRTIAGFVFQVNSTILHWLQLQPGEFLELEAGEDIDLIRADAGEASEDVERLLSQLKQLSDGSLTLRNRDALKCVANFCRHREWNPDWKLRFRFVTTLPVGQERESWEFSESAIQTWERIRAGQAVDAERVDGIAALRTFLSGCEKPPSFAEETWAVLAKTLAGNSSFTFADIVDTLEWAAGSGNHLSIKAQVLEHLKSIMPDAGDAVLSGKFDHLFAFVFERLCEPGTKTLDATALEQRLGATDASAVYLAATLRVNSRLEALEARVASLEGRVDEHDEQLRAHGESIAELQQSQEGLIKTFYSREEFFATKSPGGAIYDLDQQLRGRETTRQQLDGFLRNNSARFAVLEGSGGIGKTKVLRDWSAVQSGWTTRWTGPSVGIWHPGTANEVPHGNVLLIVDDGHRYDDLERLTTLVATWDGPQLLKLVISVRRSDNNHLGQALVRIDENAICRLPALGPLGHDDVVALAREVLGELADPYAERLATVSADSPFITVVGGRLIAQGKITPELLNNDKEFQRRVFDTLATQYEGDLPSGRYKKREFMEFIAALQPVKEADEAFIEKTATFMSLRSSEVRRGFGSLDVNGVLARKRKGSSVIPDLLADYLLGEASIEEGGRPTEFADEVFDAFEDSHFGNLLKNLAVLDWRIAHRDHSSRLLDKIWTKLSARFKDDDALRRIHTLRALEPVAGYLPDRIHGLASIAMDEPAATSNFYTHFRHAQQQVLEQVPQFFGVTILHPPTSHDAFQRLWKLAQDYEEAVRNRAQRVLEEAIGYAVGKDLLYNSHVLSMAEAHALNPDAYSGQFTPLDLLDKLMVREIDHTEMVGRSFQNSVHTINYRTVQALRQRVLRVLDTCLSSENPRVVHRAARSLGKIISIFRPMRRDHESDEERAWHDEERIEALQIIQRRIAAGALALPAVWKLRKILHSAAEEPRQSPPIRETAAGLESRLTLPELFWLFHVLCTDEWCYNTEESGFYVVSERRRAEERQSIDELMTKCPDPDARVRVVESLVGQAYAAGIDPVCIDSILSNLCTATPFLTALSDYVLATPNSLLCQVAGLAIRAWRSRDKVRYLLYAKEFIAVTNQRMVFSVAREVCSGPALQDVTTADLEIISLLATRTEAWIVGTICQALGKLGKPGPFSQRARQLIRSVDIGRDSRVADGYCQIIGHGPFSVDAQLMDLDTIQAMVQKLAPVYEIERHNFGAFFSSVCGQVPLELVDLLEARLELAKTMTPDDSQPLYKPLPSPDHWSTLSAVRQSPHYEAALSRLFDLGIKFPDHSPTLDHYFWRFGAADEVTFSVLDRGLHSDDEDAYRRTMQLLCDAPKNLAFSHPSFAAHVVSEGERRSDEWGNTAVDILVNNSMSLGGFRMAGPNLPPVGAGIADKARPLLEASAPGTPLHRLYSRLASIQPVPMPDFSPEFDFDE
jgi:hypothetical protein